MAKECLKNQTISQICFAACFGFFSRINSIIKKKKQKKPKKENSNYVRANVSFQCGQIGVVAKAAAAIRPTEAEPTKSERKVKHFQLRDATKNLGKKTKVRNHETIRNRSK